MDYPMFILVHTWQLALGMPGNEVKRTSENFHHHFSFDFLYFCGGTNIILIHIFYPIQLSLADGVIGKIRKQYIDTRTQANLSKLNASRQKDVDIITEPISKILERKRNSGDL